MNTITISDSDQNLKETTLTITCLTNTNTATATTLLPPTSTIMTCNHLELPVTNNPNLLSPDILNQRRGKYKYLFNE